MRTNAKREHRELSGRKVRTWSQQTIPSWRDFKEGGERRRRWKAYWLREGPLDLLQWVLFHLYGILPIDMVSKLGAMTARQIIPRVFPAMVGRTLKNLRWLEPTWSEEKLREVAYRQFESLGRLHAEFAIVHRLMAAGRIHLDDAQLVQSLVAAGPVILLGLHTGNWEVIASVGARLGMPTFFVYEPQASPMQNYLMNKARKKNLPPDSVTMIPGLPATRAAMRWLKQGKPLLIFCDEPIEGLVAAPFFGRPAHLKSNYAIAVRYARQCNAKLLPFHVVRGEKCNFKVHVHSPIELAPTDNAGASLLEDVRQINRVVEPIVKAHLDQWYWLNWPIDAVNYN